MGPAVGALDAAVTDVLRTQYTAAACLQRMWQTTLGLYIGISTPLPDQFGSDLSLPPLDDHYGESAIRELAARSPYNQLPAWHAVVDQLLAQLSQEARRERCGRRLTPAGSPRSSRPWVVGIAAAAACFWSGAPAWSLPGFREQTLDIDITYELPTGEHGAFVTVVQQFKDEMQINVASIKADRSRS